MLVSVISQKRVQRYALFAILTSLLRKKFEDLCVFYTLIDFNQDGMMYIPLYNIYRDKMLVRNSDNPLKTVRTLTLCISQMANSGAEIHEA